jgi:DNA glycosylase AlkZ-like
VQSQDYVGAKWAVGMRASGVDDAAVDRAYNDGRILRTHVLRPTWHFVAAEDIRWLLALTGPRVQRITRGYGRKVGLTDRVYDKARAVVERALSGGEHLTRKELAAALRGARIDVSGLRLVFLVMDIEVQGVICSGRPMNKQFTYALVSERAPSARTLSRDEALAELATRYFQSHGPATLKDFAWWSGLTMRDVKTAAALADVDVLPSAPGLDIARQATYLLSNYDEYLVAYRDRGAVIDPARARNLGVFTSREYPHQLVVDGRVGGSWRRSINDRALVVHVRPYDKLTRAKRQAVIAQTERYGQFLRLPTEVHLDG